MPINTPPSKRILIEPCLGNDYYVALYDEHNELLLDHKYLCAWYLATMACANELSKRDYTKSWQPLSIFTYKDGEEVLISRE